MKTSCLEALLSWHTYCRPQGGNEASWNNYKLPPLHHHHHHHHPKILPLHLLLMISFASPLRLTQTSSMSFKGTQTDRHSFLMNVSHCRTFMTSLHRHLQVLLGILATQYFLISHWCLFPVTRLIPMDHLTLFHSPLLPWPLWWPGYSHSRIWSQSPRPPNWFKILFNTPCKTMRSWVASMRTWRMTGSTAISTAVWRHIQSMMAGSKPVSRSMCHSKRSTFPPSLKPWSSRLAACTIARSFTSSKMHFKIPSCVPLTWPLLHSTGSPGTTMTMKNKYIPRCTLQQQCWKHTKISNDFQGHWVMTSNGLLLPSCCGQTPHTWRSLELCQYGHSTWPLGTSWSMYVGSQWWEHSII